MKFCTFVYHHKRFVELSVIIRGLYAVNDDLNTKRKKIMLGWGTFLVWLINRASVVLMMCSGGLMLSPIPMYFFTGQLESILPVMIPFVDVYTTKGYIISSIPHTYWGFQAICGLACADCLVANLMIHIWVMVDLFECSFDELNQEVMERPYDKGWSLELELWLRNLSQMHQEMTQ